METVVAAAVTGAFTLLGVWLTVRGSRRASLRQHEEQNGQLGVILENQIRFIEHTEAFSERVEAIDGKMNDLRESHEVLFGLVAEVDQKVTKSTRKRAPQEVVG